MLRASSHRGDYSYRRFLPFVIMKVVGAALAVCAFLSLWTVVLKTNTVAEPRSTVGDAKLLVFLANDATDADYIAQKNIEDFQDKAKNGQVKAVVADRNDQRRMISRNCPEAMATFDSLIQHKMFHLSRELWKYCVLARNDGPSRLYVDATSPLLMRVVDILMIASNKSNLAVLNEETLGRAIHGSLMLIQPGRQTVPKQMLALMTETPLEKLALDSLFLPSSLYDYITVEAEEETLALGRNHNWYLLEQVCTVNPFMQSGPADALERTDVGRLNHSCPQATGFCCVVRNGLDTAVLLTRHPILPYQTISRKIPRPYNAEAGHFSEDDLPYIATIQEKVFSKPPTFPRTPNFFDILMENDCLPDGPTCSKCLREKNGASCQSCAKSCPCYCKALCTEEAEKKFVAKHITVAPPLYSRNPDRLIPRIIHQTYFEELTKEKYPNMSRLVESLKRSGWDYRFYSDEDAQNFLSTHFPADVREAYDALRPGAFKADLFRYCALLIHGGAYFDVDIMLESFLDHSIPPDVGFIVPVDEPGNEAKRPYCVWNGLIGSAPGHPILARAIETVVNQVRNRFTSVDVDAMFCPDPELSVLHAFDTLHTAGPCLLGASINRVLDRAPQEPFVAGELHARTSKSSNIPGRTIILHQDKWDMGSHRFTFLEQNQVVAATDLEDSNDRANQPSTGKKTEHYSKTHKAVGIYGLEGLYKDNIRADEDISIRVKPRSAVVAE